MEQNTSCKVLSVIRDIQFIMATMFPISSTVEVGFSTMMTSLLNRYSSETSTKERSISSWQRGLRKWHQGPLKCL